MIPSRLLRRLPLPFIALLALAGSAGAEEPEHTQPLVVRSGEAGTNLAQPSAKPTDVGRLKEKTENAGLLTLGTRLTDRGDYESAEIAFRQVLNSPTGRTVDDTKSALLGLARMYRKQGSLVKAVAIFEKYLKDYPGDERTPDVLLESGRTMRAMGSHHLALARFYSVINSNLKLPDKGFEHYQQLAKTAQFEIAETHFASGEFAEAAKFFARLRLLDLAPADRARAHFKAAYALTLQGENEAAVTMLGSFLEQWPADENVPEARYLLATTLRTLGRTQDALSATLELLRSEQPKHSTEPKRWAYWQRRTGNQLANDFFERSDILNAQMIYAGLAALSDDPAWRLPVVYQIALCHERLGNVDRARLVYQDIMDATKTNAPADLAELGRMAAWRMGNLDWNNSIRHQVTGIFETTTGRTAPVAAPAKNPASP